MELMDWKEIERVSEQQIIDARKQIAIAKILLSASQIKITRLGGETNAEINKAHKRKTDK